MSKSNRLRLGEVRQALRLVGECRDLGRDTRAWFTHALRGVQQLTRARVVLGALASPQGFHSIGQLQLLLSLGWDSPSQERTAMGYLAGEAHLSDPAFQRYLALGRPNITFRPLRLISRKVFEACEYHAMRIGFGIEDHMFSQRETAHRRATFLLAPQRAPREASFDARDSKLLRLLHDELALLIGTVLSDGNGDPLANLSPRLRQTLACLLRGDSEKMVARRMGVSRHTVHEYVVTLYRHFQVHSRVQLMLLCQQRGLGTGNGPDSLGP